VSISPARRIAFNVLLRVEAEGAFATDALHAALHAQIKPADAALAIEVTMGVLRQRRLLDFLLERFSKKPVVCLDLPVAIALRMGLYQLRCLERIPAAAAVHESVELTKIGRKASAGPFVNAVLRKCAQESRKPAAEFLPEGISIAERLAILYSHPLWLVERWLARMGEGRTTALLEANNRTPRLSCTLNNSAVAETVFEELGEARLRVEPGRLLRNAFSVSGGSLLRTKAFREGLISMQDEASQAVPLLLGAKAGERVLDVCAAPGGKTAILARAVGPAGIVVAGDFYLHRLVSTKAQFARLRLDRVNLVALDAEKPLPFSNSFDRILVDAPCSGTGTLSRHPEIRWRLEQRHFDELHQLQIRILRNAIGQAAPGGRILYSTCTMEPEENEDVIEEVLREQDEHSPQVRRAATVEAADSIRAHLAAGVDATQLFDGGGTFRTTPERDGTDGFFAVLLEKKT
jgi:16S rRNA (cytosine967-C5)-methyltransferase